MAQIKWVLRMTNLIDYGAECWCVALIDSTTTGGYPNGTNTVFSHKYRMRDVTNSRFR